MEELLSLFLGVFKGVQVLDGIILHVERLEGLGLQRSAGVLVDRQIVVLKHHLTQLAVLGEHAYPPSEQSFSQGAFCLLTLSVK